jgi:hypothetical protein
MKIIKVISKQTYTGKDGKEYHYNNYAIVLPNGRKVQIRPAFVKDYAMKIIDAVAELIDNRNK